MVSLCIPASRLPLRSSQLPEYFGIVILPLTLNTTALNIGRLFIGVPGGKYIDMILYQISTML